MIAIPLAIAAIALLQMAGRIAADRAIAGVESNARGSAILLASSFRRELDKFRLLPVVLADDGEAREALLLHQPSRITALNEKLEELSRETRAATLYLLDNRGVTVAASNWRQPTSFVGDTYDYRTYFREALLHGDAQQFALGQRSKRPGLYISRSVSLQGRPIGVIVVKVEFDALESEWRETPTDAFVTDGRGIMLVTSNPGWRFQTVTPLSEAERNRARRSLEYGAVALTQNNLFAQGAVIAAGAAATPRTRYIEATEMIEGRWRVHVLAPLNPMVDNAATFARTSVATGILAIAALIAVWRHRRRLRAARAEAETAGRLADLNDRLVQANKLATLGQITAGVGHEINQPLAAITAFAHNAKTLIVRKRINEAAEAVDRITAVAERIGVITRELRGFARRASGQIEDVSVSDTIDGVVLLLRHRFRAHDIDFVADPTTVSVRAERVRLEQVLVNLVQNSLDAGARHIAIQIRPPDASVELAVVDDGPGLAPEMRETLFHPFKTSKRDGLGLGLVICHDIVASLGGKLEARSPSIGAEFVITLERAR